MGRNPLRGGYLSSSRQSALTRGRAPDLSACQRRRAQAAWGCGVRASRPAGHYVGSGTGSWDEQSGSVRRVTDQR
jgi:hypothetical protein